MEPFFFVTERQGKHILMTKDVDEESGFFCIVIKSELEPYVRPSMTYGYETEEKMEQVWETKKDEMIDHFLQTISEIQWIPEGQEIPNDVKVIPFNTNRKENEDEANGEDDKRTGEEDSSRN